MRKSFRLILFLLALALNFPIYFNNSLTVVRAADETAQTIQTGEMSKAGQKLVTADRQAEPSPAIIAAIVGGAFALVTTLLTSVVTYMVTRRNASTQRDLIEKQIRSQEKNLYEQLKAQEKNLKEQLRTELDNREKLEMDRKQSLVVAIAIECVSIWARSEVYTDQISGYEELTNYNIDRLRIIPKEIEVEWQNNYFFRTAACPAQIEKLKTIIQRANRKLDELKSFLGKEQVISSEKFKPNLIDLSKIYAKIADDARNLTQTLRNEFPDLGIFIEQAETELRIPRQTTRVPGHAMDDDGMVSRRIIRHPFGSGLEP